MCKFCKLTDFNGEKSTMNRIKSIKDGSQIFGLSLFRDIVESDGIRDASLVLELGVVSNGFEYALKDKPIAIKYCPFCGEEL